MNFVTKIAASAVLAAGIMLAPVAALAYYPYTYFTGQNYFMGGGGFNAPQPNYYGSSNCNAIYGCGTIGYNAMTGQWTNGGMDGYGNYGYGYGSKMGYGSYGGANAYSGVGSFNQNSYNQYNMNGGCGGYIPSNACGIMSQYGYGGYGMNTGYNGGYIY